MAWSPQYLTPPKSLFDGSVVLTYLVGNPTEHSGTNFWINMHRIVCHRCHDSQNVRRASSLQSLAEFHQFFPDYFPCALTEMEQSASFPFPTHCCLSLYVFWNGSQSLSYPSPINYFYVDCCDFSRVSFFAWTVTVDRREIMEELTWVM